MGDGDKIRIGVWFLVYVPFGMYLYVSVDQCKPTSEDRRKCSIKWTLRCYFVVILLHVAPHPCPSVIMFYHTLLVKGVMFICHWSFTRPRRQPGYAYSMLESILLISQSQLSPDWFAISSRCIRRHYWLDTCGSPAEHCGHYSELGEQIDSCYVFTPSNNVTESIVIANDNCPLIPQFYI